MELTSILSVMTRSDQSDSLNRCVAAATARSELSMAMICVSSACSAESASKMLKVARAVPPQALSKIMSGRVDVLGRRDISICRVKQSISPMTKKAIEAEDKESLNRFGVLLRSDSL